jgi:hypothetical protein
MEMRCLMEPVDFLSDTREVKGPTLGFLVADQLGESQSSFIIRFTSADERLEHVNAGRIIRTFAS